MAVPHEHRVHAPASVRCGVITISDSRTEATDDSGRLIREMLAHAGHTVAYTAIVKDEPPAIAAAVEAASRPCDAIITNGGTGFATRDVTIPTIAPALDRTMPGFGELFRALSFEAIGSAAMLSGALAGVYRGRFLVCLPGSPDACRLAMERLILRELPHVVGLLRR